MDELKRALYALVDQAGLSAAEVANLSIKDLHLAGAEPSITIYHEETDDPKSIKLSQTVRNALVGWMLLRPDRPTALLFLDDDGQSLTAAGVAALLKDYKPTDTAPPEPPPVVSAAVQAAEGLPRIDPRSGSPPRRRSTPFRPTPPPAHSPERLGEDPSPARPERIATPPPNPPETVIPTTNPPAGKHVSPAQPAANPASPYSAEPVETLAPAPNGRKKRASWRTGLLVTILLLAVVLAGACYLLPEQMAQLTALVDLTPLTALIGDGSQPPSEIAGEDPEPQATVVFVAGAISPLPTPTPSPSPTPQPTATPLPTATPEPTATSEPTATPTAAPTITPEPTDTPEPTPTPEPTETLASEPVTPTPDTSVTPTPGFKYPAPTLLAPEDEADFIRGNTIDLKWESVGELAAGERYAVRLIYMKGTEFVYQGANLQETQWTIPMSLFGEANGPDFAYVWYVYVERVGSDDIGVPISPESERRDFVWRN